MHPIQEKLLSVASSKNLGTLTLREIGVLLGEVYPQKVKHHLLQLEKKGLLRIDKHRRLIEAARGGAIKKTGLISVPIVGTANCGPATFFADENVEGYLKISARLLRKRAGIFAIRASGLSMNKALVRGQNIEDGDYLIVDHEDRDPHDGDIVVSVIDGMANVKRFRRDPANRQIVLISDSTRHFPPIYIHLRDNFMINGKVIQVLKKPSP